jgi:hypothetical protein
MFTKMKKYWEAGKNANGDPDLIYSKILTPPGSQK